MDIKRLHEQLEHLDKQGLLAFSLSCLERLYPNYDVFCHLVNSQFSPIYHNMLDVLWNHLSQSVDIGIQVEEYKKMCFKIAPDSEEYSIWLTSLAIDAVSGIYNTLEFIETGELDHIARVSRNLFDSLDTYLYIVNTPNLELEIDDGGYASEKYPLNRAEYDKQMEDIEFLKNVDGLSEEEVISFRERSQGGLLLFKRGLFLRD